MTKVRMTSIACFTLLCAGSLPAFGAATGSSTYTLEEAESDSSAHVVFTVSVSLERMMPPAPGLDCELRSDQRFPGPGVLTRAADSGLYGQWSVPLPIDNVSGTGSAALTARIRIIERNTNRPLGADRPVYVRCRLLPYTRPGANPNTDGVWQINAKPPAGDITVTNVVKPGAILEVSGQAQ